MQTRESEYATVVERDGRERLLTTLDGEVDEVGSEVDDIGLVLDPTDRVHEASRRPWGELLQQEDEAVMNEAHEGVKLPVGGTPTLLLGDKRVASS